MLPAPAREHVMSPHACHPERSEVPHGWRERVVVSEILRLTQDDNAMLSFAPSTGGALALHHHPAVDGQDLARNVFRFRRGKEGDRGRDIFSFAESA